MHTITIREHDGCYDCKIGCQHHFFLTVEGMLAELTEYMQDPIRVEDRWDQFRELTRQKSMPIGGNMTTTESEAEDCCLTRPE